MAFETQPQPTVEAARETTNVIPELRLDLKPVPEDSPEAFADALINNVRAARDGFVDYLNANRGRVLKENEIKFAKCNRPPESLEHESAEIDLFIATIQLHSASLIIELRRNRGRPINEQREIASASQVYGEFVKALWKDKAVMQSFIPYRLQPGYDAIERWILMPSVDESLRQTFEALNPGVWRSRLDHADTQDKEAEGADAYLKAALGGVTDSEGSTK